MNLQAPPARLTRQQKAWYLGFQFHDIPTLVKAGLLKPLGRLAPNGLKYFATVELEKLRTDIKWLARASDAIKLHWRRKNHSKATPLCQTLQAGDSRRLRGDADTCQTQLASLHGHP